MSVLGELEPKRVFEIFETLCGIPHGSGNCKEISDFCVAFAENLGLECVQDAIGNVIIKKPASKGYENHPAVVLQGHLDMVCEKTPDCDIDFKKDALRLKTDGKLVWAEGTTLGGDDGVAVAMVLAILEDNTFCHPPLEALFTVDEETGMYGAGALDGKLVSGRILINIDSEGEGVLTAGCAGGAHSVMTMPFDTQTVSLPFYKIVIDGLEGGHSGIEAGAGKQNAVILMGKLLSEISDVHIASVMGGLKDNAFPCRCEALIAANGDVEGICRRFCAENTVPTDKGLKITASPAGGAPCAVQSDVIISLLCSVPNGVIKMSEDIEGLVQTSSNLGICKIADGKLHCTFLIRSSKNAEKYEVLDALETAAKKHGAAFAANIHYPAWEYRKNSRLRDVMTEVFCEQYNKKPQTVTIHAGLECGLLGEKLAGLDAVSIGPDMFDIHTVNEALDIASTARVYNFVRAVLERL